MQRRIRLKNSIVVLLLASFLFACQEEVEVVEEEQEIMIDQAYMKEKTMSITQGLIDGQVDSFNAHLKEGSFSNSLQGCSVKESSLLHVEDTYVEEEVFLCDGQEKWLHVLWDEEANIQSYEMMDLPEAPILEESNAYQEEILPIGSVPTRYGVLTLPTNKDNPMVAILVPNHLDASSDAMKALAHGLAEKGIASVRYDMRLYQMPKRYEDPYSFSLNEFYFEDFAAVTHMLEHYPVNAGAIHFIGEGLGGYFGLTSVYHHFEITGGILMLNPPSGTGLQVCQNLHGASEVNISDIQEAIKHKEVIEGLIGGYPFSYWKEWNSVTPQNYIGYVNQKIAVLNTQTADTTWRQYLNGRKASVVKGYPRVTRFSDGEQFNETVLVDIVDWMNGKDITKDVRRR